MSRRESEAYVQLVLNQGDNETFSNDPFRLRNYARLPGPCSIHLGQAGRWFLLVLPIRLVGPDQVREETGNTD